MREDAESPQVRVVQDALAAHLQPIGRSKIDGFGKVIALVETGVVRPREGDDELAGMLVCAEDRHASAHKDVRVHYGHQLVQQVRLGLEEFGGG